MTREPANAATPRPDRRVLIGLGGLVAALAVIFAVVVVTGTGSPASAPLATSPLGPVGTNPPSTTLVPPPVSATAPASTVAPTTVPPAATVDLPIDGSGAVLQPPSTADVRTEDAPNDCASLVDPGWESIDCKVVETGSGGLTYLIEVLPAQSYIATRVYVLRQVGTGSEQVVLRAEDDTGSRFESSEVEAVVDPTVARGNPAIVIGFLGGGGRQLRIDVVSSPGVVAVHQDLGDGVVHAAADALDTWAGSAGGASFVHDTIRQVGRTWHIVAQQSVRRGDVPQTNAVA